MAWRRRATVELLRKVTEFRRAGVHGRMYSPQTRGPHVQSVSISHPTQPPKIDLEGMLLPAGRRGSQAHPLQFKWRNLCPGRRRQRRLIRLEFARPVRNLTRAPGPDGPPARSAPSMSPGEVFGLRAQRPRTVSFAESRSPLAESRSYRMPPEEQCVARELLPISRFRRWCGPVQHMLVPSRSLSRRASVSPGLSSLEMMERQERLEADQPADVRRTRYRGIIWA